MASPDLRFVLDKVERFTARLMAQIGFEVVAELVETTPVDTGWARANWVPRIGQPVAGPSGTREAVSTADQSQGLASLAGYKIEQGAIYVTNHVPYIKALNNGHSKQAPAGFVEESVLRALRAVEAKNQSTVL